MIKRQLIVKTLLVAVGMMMGVSAAWATEPDTDGYSIVYTNDFESGSSPWGWTEGLADVSLITEDGDNNFLSVTRKSTNYNRTLLFTKNYDKYDLTFKWFYKYSYRGQIKFITDYSKKTTGWQYRFNNPTSDKLCLTDKNANSSTQEITNYTKSTDAPTSVSTDFYTVRVASDGVNVRFTFTNSAGTSVVYDEEWNDKFLLGGIQLQSQTTSDVLYIDDIVLKVPTENYTINYKLGDEIIKTETGTAADGATISATLPDSRIGRSGHRY